MKKEIRNVLESFQAAYDLKEIDQVDLFMSNLFGDNANIAIIGTSDGELCLDYNSCKELFISDWKYWGFEKLNIDSATIQELNEYTIVYVPSSFTFEFKDNDDNRENHFNDIISALSDDSKDQRALKIKLGEFNYELVHIYHSRKGDVRKYQFDLRVCFIFNNVDYKVKQINFSIPDNIRRPDARLYQGSSFNRYLDYELNKLKSKQTENTASIDQVSQTLNNCFNNYFDINTINSFFDDNLFVINVDEKIALNTEELKSLLQFQQQFWKELSIQESSYIEVNKDQAIVIAKAVAKSNESEEEYFEQTRKEILSISKSDLNVKEKMFKIKQLITIAFKEAAIGSTYERPIRLHLVLSLVNGLWKINYMQMSYSFYYLLEDRNEHMRRI